MRKPYSTSSGKARHRVGDASKARPDGDLTSERRSKIALSRFTYSGGYDGFEGRMILKPEMRRSGCPDGSR